MNNDAARKFFTKIIKTFQAVTSILKGKEAYFSLKSCALEFYCRLELVADWVTWPKTALFVLFSLFFKSVVLPRHFEKLKT